MVFQKLGIADFILQVIYEEKFEKPSEIQEKSIPLILEGRDVIAESATGSGKTLAFGVGIIQNITKGGGIKALVLAPTRELAEQVCKELKKFSKHKPLSMVTVYGGVSLEPQTHALRHADVVVGTPGRILDHLQRRTIDLSHVKLLTLDEADRMLDLGFLEDVEEIISRCPSDRQTLLFSATMPSPIARLGERFMRNPATVSAESHVDPKKLTQIFYNAPDNLKFSLLVHLLKKEREGLVMIFCNTQRSTDFVSKNLQKCGIDAMAIHGGFSQAKRTSVLERFSTSKFLVLVCTDVAARGLDIKGVSHVYNYDLPNESKQYIHRIGRTGRAGKEGKAINLLTQRDHDNFRRILWEYQIEIPEEPMPMVERVSYGWRPQQDSFHIQDRSGGSRFLGPHRGPRHFGRGGSSRRSSSSSRR